MTAPRIVRWGALLPQPWKNGGGETVEIAAYPDGASMEAFDWRLSAAVVARAGPFSVFPGIDRSLSLLEGESMVLAVEGRVPAVLTQDSPPYAFPGDAPTSAAVPRGPIRDFNLMTRRGRISADVTRIDLTGPTTIVAEDATLIVFVAAGRIVLPLAQEELTLFDTSIGERDLTVAPLQRSRLIVARLRPA